MWADVRWIREYFDNMRFAPHQRVNHFRNHFELTRKDNLVKNINRMRRQLERSGAAEEAAKYNFLPTSYVLPGDYGLFVEQFKRSSGALWIMKPIGGAQGRGIFLFSKLSQITEWKKDVHWSPDAPQADTYVVQRYIANPYTIGGKKFDMRLYVLVTSFAPLTAWVYRAGFARFSTSRYDSSSSTQGDLQMHLTNVAVQKHTTEYRDTAASHGMKWDLTALKLFMASKHGLPAVERCMARIQAMLIRSLLAVQKVMMADKAAFELYGYDVMLDADLAPWLIEVNASPSLTATTTADYQLKYGLIADALDIVDMEQAGHASATTVGGFDLVWKDGPVDSPLPEPANSCLGTFNPTAKRMQHLVLPAKHRKPGSDPGAASSDAAASGAAKSRTDQL